MAVDLSGERPALRIESHAQKARRSEIVPEAPDFAAMLLDTPEADRRGKVFRGRSLTDGGPLPAHRVGMILSRIGETAGVKTGTDPDTGEAMHATAHDLRRSFATPLGSEDHAGQSEGPDAPCVDRNDDGVLRLDFCGRDFR